MSDSNTRIKESVIDVYAYVYCAYIGTLRTYIDPFGIMLCVTSSDMCLLCSAV